MNTTSFENLKQFLEKDMRMSHIYQPVFIKELLQNNGSVSLHNIAKVFLNYDTSQQEYYEYVTKTMPSRILKKHNIITQHNDTYSLTHDYSSLTKEEAELLITICDKKIDDFLGRKQDIYDHRKRNFDNLSGSLRYRIIKRSGGKCEACGISSEIRAIDVDHIIPKSKGGSDDESNLQALCYKCNREKRDTDDTNFEKIKLSYDNREKTCVFCNLVNHNIKIIAENELALAFYDGFAVTQYHTLIIPKRHIADYFELHQPEINAINDLVKKQKLNLAQIDNTITGFNVGVNCGEDAGQSIFHVHVHLIPRRKYDCVNPKGGVRGVIPEKQSY